MTRGWPPVADERLLTLRSILPPLPKTAASGESPWRSSRLFSRVAFFFLTVLAASALNGFFGLIMGRESLIVCGLGEIAVAEWLIVGKKFFKMGPEEALWIVGVQSVIFRILEMFKGGEPEKATILIGAGFLAAGLRLLNPLFTTLAAACFVWYAKAISGSEEVAAIMAIAVAVGAAILLRRTFARPSHDSMLEWLVVSMTITGWIWMSIPRGFDGLIFGRSPHGAVATVAVFAVLAVVFATIALRWRLHAPLVAAGLSLAAVAFDCHDLFAVAYEWKLIAVGAVVLIVAVALERRLRLSDSGITAQRILSHNELSLLQTAGALALAGPSTSAPDQNLHGGGGSFGGAGATGDV
jgi:hypothetical protein